MTVDLANIPKTLIRPMTVADIAPVVAIEVEVTAEPWSTKQFQQSLEQHQCWVICGAGTDNNQPIGYVVTATAVDQTEILNIAIDPQYQGRKLGSQLLRHTMGSLSDSIESVLLEVRVSNFSAIRLYFNYGFIEVGRRRDYYRTEYGREDAILMTLQPSAAELAVEQES